MIVEEKDAMHAVRQYLYRPCRKTFENVKKIVGLIVSHALEYAELDYDPRPIIGHVLGKLSKCKKEAVKFIANEALKFMKKLYQFENQIG